MNPLLLISTLVGGYVLYDTHQKTVSEIKALGIVPLKIWIPQGIPAGKDAKAVNIELNIYNPGAKSINLQGLNASIVYDGRTIGKFNRVTQLELPANTIKVLTGITIFVSINDQAILDDIIQNHGAGASVIELTGTITANGSKVNINKQIKF